MFSRNDLVNATIDSQHCQRNWNITKEIPEEDILFFTKILSSSPLKQNINYFDINIIRSRTTIDQIYKVTNFVPDGQSKQKYALNPQHLPI